MVKKLPDLERIKNSRLRQVFSSRRNRILLIVGVLVLGAVIATVIVLSKPTQDEKDTADMNELSAQTTLLVEDYKYGQAVALWQAFLKKPLSPEVKCEASLRYGITLLDSLKYNDAYENLTGLQESCPNVDQYSLNLGIAESAEASARIQPAIDGYKKMVELEKQRQEKPPKDFNKEESDKMIARYEENIKILELNLW